MEEARRAIGIRHLSYWLGDESAWYRTLPDIEARMRELAIPDDEELWGWGYFRRSSRSYAGQLAGGFAGAAEYIAREHVRCDAVLGCSPCHGDSQRFVDTLRSEILPSIGTDGDALRMVEKHDCVNLLQAVSEAQALIDTGCEDVLVLAAEKVDDERNRFRKYSLFSDFCLALIVSSRLDCCAHEIRDVLVHPDPQPREDTSAIFMRALEEQCIGHLLTRNGCGRAQIGRFFYMNLYDPIAQMKGREIGFARGQLCTQLGREIGHCYGADPFIALQRLGSGLPGMKPDVLCASGRWHVGACIVSQRGAAPL